MTYRFLMLPALAALAFTACKPTPRTAIAKQRPPQQAQQGGADASQATTSAAGQAGSQAQEAPQALPASIAASLLTVSATRQDFNRLRPWEKESPSRARFMGIYLGEGRVLTSGDAAKAATYVELSLPDGSRTVPARVLRYDRDLNLALLTPVHEADAAIFDSREALPLGGPLKLGDVAEFRGIVRGLIPVRIALHAESSEMLDGIPRLSMRAAQPVPQGGAFGLPIVKDGKLVGITAGYNEQSQLLTCTNAELISRFLAAEDGEHDSSPLLGIQFTELDDPVFRAYLKLAADQGGIYINEVVAAGAADAAGLRAGDVVTAIDGLPLDSQGRCVHPLYGAIHARAIIRSLKPLGEKLTLSISRDGEKQEITVPLDRSALENGFIPRDAPGVQPRYVMWGGLLFQAVTEDYLRALSSKAKGSLPMHYLETEHREKEWREKGITELVALSLVIPTPATLSYDDVGYSLVESVNGKTVHNFAEFVQLLDEPTADGLVAIGLNKAPYTIYVDRQVAEACNSVIRRSAFHHLRQLGGQAGQAEDPVEAAAPAPEATEAPAQG